MSRDLSEPRASLRRVGDDPQPPPVRPKPVPRERRPPFVPVEVDDPQLVSFGWQNDRRKDSVRVREEAESAPMPRTVYGSVASAHEPFYEE